MKIILLLACVVAVAASFDVFKYKQQFSTFCSGVNKNACIKENLELGLVYFQKQVDELESKARLQRQGLRKAAKSRRIEKMKKEIFLLNLRKHFLDRHL